eukprot:5683828-Karenia_brevis.AAC.1
MSGLLMFQGLVERDVGEVNSLLWVTGTATSQCYCTMTLLQIPMRDADIMLLKGDAKKHF